MRASAQSNGIMQAAITRPRPFENARPTIPLFKKYAAAVFSVPRVQKFASDYHSRHSVPLARANVPLLTVQQANVSLLLLILPLA